MALDPRCIDCCNELIGSIPDDERKQYFALLSYESVPYIDELHEGLTYLAISCMELAVLFSKFESEENHEIVVQRMTVGYLFEVYNSIWAWIGKPAKDICDARNLPTDEYIVLKKRLDLSFSKYLP